MARNPNQISLYEALRRDKLKGRKKNQKAYRSVPVSVDTPVVKEKAPKKPVLSGDVGYTNKQVFVPENRLFSGFFQRKGVKIIAGVGFVLILALVVSIFLIFANPSGQKVVTLEDKEDVSQPIHSDGVGRKNVERRPVRPISDSRETEVIASESASVDGQAGTNAIAIQGIVVSKQRELEPVRKYFEANGIPTEIIKRRGYAVLVTKQLFDDPGDPGTDGYRMLQKVKRIGAGYKAPEGYLNFGKTPFQDAYGINVK